MATTAPFPMIPFPLPFYDSYEIDPQWQLKFTVIWASVLGVATILSLPAIFRSIHPKRILVGLLGIRECNAAKNYAPVSSLECDVPALVLSDSRRRNRVYGFFRAIGSICHLTPPKLSLNLSHMVLIGAYLGLLGYCIGHEARLMENPNRAGFMALAQLPIVFLFGTKNSVLSLLLGPGNGYERLNFIHRWSGRGMFFAALAHGSLWIRNRVRWGRGVVGSPKAITGLAALILLCVIVLTSLPIFRRLLYRFFIVTHIVAYVAFAITIFHHTSFAGLWLYPPMLLYAADMLLRFFKYRVKDAQLIAIDDQMTLIRVPDCDAGWEAGQHVQLRVFFRNRFMESHPLSIVTAPPSTSCISNEGIVLAVRACGDWSKALNEYANSDAQQSHVSALTLKAESELATGFPEVPIRVMLDGPYGGCSINLGRYENVLFLAGGSGATFTISLLDDLVARCAKLRRPGDEKTNRIEFVWCIRSFDAMEWFAPLLATIVDTAMKSTLDLHISIFVTSLRSLLPDVTLPNTDIRVGRPSISALLRSFASMPHGPNRALTDKELAMPPQYGGVAVCASGPESLTREAANAVVQVNLSQGIRLGGIALHTEKFSM
ncbi:hypothetical protein PC9H_005664 [Pleurotus ostreatus]|uniref:ferric-chelate reductase (NADPH) n=1 Tax=Pleurotus ostreatus TaxID=5322 RepID=A0A8H7DT52_PLEOS|nr:uncharacterized protein PC9H_005664 [Pleurotus ostreatus]KAF7433701.1 hypothetical protein PC9H_005664 [Pleurotus ostreatus]KAJ8697539.1 hypothetical protein PTI98_004332 [Pleurotus ostreatus]